jgi:DNA excision repair protein ERCC-2
MSQTPKKVSIGIVECALPVPRRGSIEAVSGFGSGPQIGAEIHQRVQARRRRENPSYRAEVPITRQFERDDYPFEISGHIDGMIGEPRLAIEEIKSGCLVNSIFMGRGAPGEHESSVAKLLFRDLGSL